MQHVFISYKREDADFAENLINKLEQKGFSTWADSMIGAGEEWRTAIDLAIRNSFALVVVVTPESSKSEYVTYEWAFAWGNGIRVIPLLLRQATMHPRLAALQNLDFSSLESRPWTRLMAELSSAASAPLTTTISVPLSAPPFIRAAVVALDSANRDDRVAAVTTLAAAATPATRDVLTEALRHPLPDVRQSAAEELGDLGEKSAIEGLVTLTHDSALDVQIAAVKALGKISGELATKVLVDLLKDSRPEVRGAAAHALGESGDASHVEFLKAMLKDADGDVRANAAGSLRKVGDQSALMALREVLQKDTDWRSRQAATAALGALGGMSVVNTLSELLQDPDGQVRGAAAFALGEIDDSSVTPLLTALASDPDDDVRFSVAEALGNVGDLSAIDPLTLLARDSQGYIRMTAIAALSEVRARNLASSSAVTDQLAALESETPSSQSMAEPRSSQFGGG